ncbi:hypothetical protein ACH4M4_23770 [Streptomyces sp. NPDC017254]|uniref:hypothetical protein n=1 Tax=unclassified Streptomyces TaxID=2593676 RepID=UPI00378F15BB
MTGVLVLAVTSGAARLGPELTGVLAPFPIATSVVAVFAPAQGGSAAAEATMAGVLRGLWGFIAFCFLVAVLVAPLGAAAAFGIAAIASLATPPLARLISAPGHRSAGVTGWRGAPGDNRGEDMGSYERAESVWPRNSK